MARHAARIVAFAALLSLAACVLPGGGGAAKAPNPIAGDAITMTELDAPAAAPAAVDVPAEALAEAREAPVPDAAAAEVLPAAEVAAPVAAAPVPEVQKTPAQLACEKRKGQWSRTGEGGHACVMRMRDGGQQCRSGSECDGACLARSGTCSPYEPLFGCNEILDDMGRRMTLCID